MFSRIVLLNVIDIYMYALACNPHTVFAQALLVALLTFAAEQTDDEEGGSVPDDGGDVGVGAVPVGQDAGKAVGGIEKPEAA